MTAPALPGTKYPGSVASWLRHTNAVFQAYIDRRPFSNNVPCGTCTACCHGYEIEVLPTDNSALEVTAGTMFPRVLPRTKDGTCSYLIEDHCSIYPIRPASCREFDCRRFAYIGLRGDREDLNAAADQWDMQRVIKTRDDRIAFDALITCRDELHGSDFVKRNGLESAEALAVFIVSYAYQRFKHLVSSK
jgi:hypothetical protein